MVCVNPVLKLNVWRSQKDLISEYMLIEAEFSENKELVIMLSLKLGGSCFSLHD